MARSDAMVYARDHEITMESKGLEMKQEQFDDPKTCG